MLPLDGAARNGYNNDFRPPAAVSCAILRGRSSWGWGGMMTPGSVQPILLERTMLVRRGLLLRREWR